VHAGRTTNITAIGEIRIGPGGTGHTQSGGNFMSFKPNELRVTGYTAEQQYGIYARFA
jgi:hypothetical protein